MHTKKTVQRYFIYLAYDGTAYHGWQIQPNGASVQECLMKALSTLLRREVEVVGAGRTDAGVHASLMVAHFDSDSPLDTVFMTDKLNRLLPPGYFRIPLAGREVPMLMRALMLRRVCINIMSLRPRCLSIVNIVAVCSKLRTLNG